MAKSRKELHERLLTLVDHAYYQPPPSVHLEYPCIIYKRAGAWVNRADDKPYLVKNRYDITYISKGVDDDYDYKNDIPVDTMVSKILNSFDMISYDRFYTADNLNHNTFTLYF